MRPSLRCDALRNQRGATLVFVLLVGASLVSLTVAGLTLTRSDVKVARHHGSTLQAKQSATSGALRAQRKVHTRGVIASFQTDVIPNWETIHGSDAKAIGDVVGASSVVTPRADEIDPDNYMWLVVSGTGPEEARRAVDVRLAVTIPFSPGAIYLANPDVESDFNGNRFLVDGNNVRLDGSDDPDNPDVPGISTKDDDARDAVKSSLSGGQTDNVVGLGGSPSVKTADSLTMDEIRNGVIPGILARGGVVTNPHLNGNDVFGTNASPRITHFTGDVTINGTVDGAGILIVDGGLKLNGTMTFNGLIIVQGTTDITTITGNTTVLGAIWTTELELTVAGSASVTYSTEALQLAGLVGGPSVPRGVKAVAWKEY